MNHYRRNIANAFLNWLITHRNLLLFVVISISLGFAVTISDLKVERTLNLTYDPNSPSHAAYQDFVNTFGTDQSVLFAVQLPNKINESHHLKSLIEVTERLQHIEGFDDVLAITNLRLPDVKEGRFGVYPLVLRQGQNFSIDLTQINSLRKTWPTLNMLLSNDLKTIGILITLRENEGFGPETKRILKQAEQTIRAGFPDGSNLHQVGVPIIVLAFQKYNIQTALYVGLLAGLVATLVALYLFKSFRVTLLVFVNGGLAVVCLMGLMSVLGVELHMVTSVAFGVIIILTIPTVVHIISHFNHHQPSSRNSKEALEQTLIVVFRPCFMCSITTAVGFASLMLSPMRVVSQMGLIMSIGTMFSFLVTMIVTINYVLMVKPPSPRTHTRMARDWLSHGLQGLGDFVFYHHRLCMAGGLIVVVVMAMGAPYIKTDAPGSHMLRKSSPEAKSMEFVEKYLIPLDTVSIVVDGPKDQSKESDLWSHSRLLLDRLKATDGVIDTVSLIPVLENVFSKLNNDKEQTGTLYTNPKAIPQVLFLISSSDRGQLFLDKYLSSEQDKLHITLLMNKSPTDTMNQMVDRIREVVDSHWKCTSSAMVTGHLALVVDQSRKLLRAQVISLGAAFVLISLLLAIQFGSLTLGVLSLIPNIFPLVVVFGIMGWFGIHLDSLTVIVAVVSFGLSVDDTIHYLTQLQREMRTNSNKPNVKQSLYKAYLVTGRALVSTSAILCLGFLTFLGSSYVPGIAFGILAASAIVGALVGDLVFMPAVILSCQSVSGLLERRING